MDLNSGVFQRKDLRLFQPTEWVIPSAGFFSKTSECDALVQNGAFFMELDAAAIMESINKGNGINPDVIGAISSNRKFALVYKGEIVAQGSRYDRAYQKVLQDLKRASSDPNKIMEVLDRLFHLKLHPKIFAEAKLIAKNNLLDCSEIAEEILSEFNFGEILELTQKQGRWMKGYENGMIDDWVYHQIFVSDDTVFDPWFSNAPVSLKNYMDEMNKINPNGLNINNITNLIIKNEHTPF